MQKFKQIISFIILALLIIFVGCDKSQGYADKYALYIATNVALVKYEKEFYHPTKSEAMSLLAKNEDEIPIENFEIIQIGEGKIVLSVNGKIGKAEYQSQDEYRLEKEKRVKILTTGPVIKHFYLGMSLDSVYATIDRILPNDREFARDSNLVYEKTGSPGNSVLTTKNMD